MPSQSFELVQKMNHNVVMSRSLTFYLNHRFNDLEALIEAFKEEFETLLEDAFTDEELKYYERDIDHLAAIYVQPIISELTFDDFYSDPSCEDEQRQFFNACRSSIVLENLPYLETNSFQVTYLLELLKKFDEALIDQGGVNELLFKEKFLTRLQKYKTIDGLIPLVVEKKIIVQTSKPVDPIDFLVLDVYKELDRLGDITLNTEDLPEKIRKILNVMKGEKSDSHTLFRKSGLNAKDFDDGLERLKFWLRKF